MSYRGWMDVEVKVDFSYEEQARSWAKLKGYAVAPGKERLSVYKGGEAGWLDSAVDDLRNDLSLLEYTFEVPLEAWNAEVFYKSYEDPEESCSMVEFRISGGKIVDWKQSQVEMVDAEPWFDFDMTEEEA